MLQTYRPLRGTRTAPRTMTLYQMLPQMFLPETALIPRQIPLFFTSDLLSYTQHPVLDCILFILLTVLIKQLTVLVPPLLNC